MKKIISAVTAIVMLCLLCSCNNAQTYINQDNVNLNYNNISAGSGCWMDNNYICSIEHNFGFDLYLMDDTKKDKIDSLSYSYDAHLYNNKLYYFDDVGLSSTKYEFIEYDLNTQKRKTIATITNERVYNYYIVDKYLYIEVGDNNSLIRDIVCISLDTNQQITVAQNIFSSGIVNGKLNYIIQNELKYSIYSFDADNKKNTLLGDFELKHDRYNSVSDGSNFNAEYITFACSVGETAKSKIYVYRYNDTLTSCDFNGQISEFVSYDKFAYFIAYDNTSENHTESIYRFNFNDNSVEKITELSGYNILFVGSDDEVYVSSTEFNGIRRYSVDGKYEDVILN